MTRNGPKFTRYPSMSLGELEAQGLLSLGRGRVISKQDLAAKPGNYPVYSSAKENGGKFGEYGHYMFDEELITWSVDGGGRLFHRSKHRFSVTNVGGTLRVNDPIRLDCRYLYFMLTYLHSIVVFDWVQKAHPSVVRKVYDTIPLPPLDEQRRIVAVLDEAFAAIATATANAEKNLASARELSAMFPASSSEQSVRLTVGALLDCGWLNGHMDGNHGGDYPRKDEFVREGVTYLSANCIRDGQVDFGRAKFLSSERARKLRKGFAKNGDVLFAHNATVGPVALLQTEDDFVVLGTSLTYYRCNENFIAPEYLASYLASPGFVNQYSAIMRQSTRNQVPITKQREFFVELPPIAEQRRIMASLRSFQDDGRALAKIYQSKIEALSALKHSLLHRAFTGELTAAAPDLIPT